MFIDASDDKLLRQAIAGDRVALERLLLAHYDSLSQHVAPKMPTALHEHLGVDDILQQTFVQAFRDIGKFEPRGEAAFSNWLKTIADHRLRDAIKAARRKKRGGRHRRISRPACGQSGSMVDLIELISSEGRSPSGSAAGREAVQAVQAAFDQLPSDQREAIDLHYLQGESVPETAALMNRTPAAIRGLLHRAKQTLREALGSSSLWFSKKE